MEHKDETNTSTPTEQVAQPTVSDDDLYNFLSTMKLDSQTLNEIRQSYSTNEKDMDQNTQDDVSSSDESEEETKPTKRILTRSQVRHVRNACEGARRNKNTADAMKRRKEALKEKRAARKVAKTMQNLPNSAIQERSIGMLDEAMTELKGLSGNAATDSRMAERLERMQSVIKNREGRKTALTEKIDSVISHVMPSATPTHSKNHKITKRNKKKAAQKRKRESEAALKKVTENFMDALDSVQIASTSSNLA